MDRHIPVPLIYQYHHETTKREKKYSIMDREPWLLATKYFEFHCNTDVKIVCDYFKKRKASAWCIQDYIEYICETSTELDFAQALALFIENLTLMNQLISTPVSVRSFCSAYLAWLKVQYFRYFCWWVSNHMDPYTKKTRIITDWSWTSNNRSL